MFTSFYPNFGPIFGPRSLSIWSDNELMNAEKSCHGYTGGGEHDCFDTPLVDGFSILTGESKG